MDGVSTLSERLWPDLDLGTHEVREKPLAALLGELKEGSLEVVLAPLSELPVVLPEDLGITALSKRGRAGWVLTVPSAIAQQGAALMLRSGTTVTGDPVALAQLFQLREDLLPGDNGAKILPWWQVPDAQASTGSFHNIELQCRELVPKPGSGVIAMICRKGDVAVRTVIRQFHHPDTMILTNVERTFCKLLPVDWAQQCFAWCEKDALNNYRLWAGCIAPGEQLLKAQRTYNTHAGLAEDLVKEIQMIQSL